MNCPTNHAPRQLPGGTRHKAFTLIEVMVAALITLILMAAVSGFFSWINTTIVESRAAVEMHDRIRHTKHRLQADLAGVTAPLNPPLRPEAGQGYFEYIEGPIGPVRMALEVTNNSAADDPDDILMFTARSFEEPFVGLYGGSMTHSNVAEICWFLRGTSLMRRVLLVRPDLPITVSDEYLNRRFYGSNDLSMRQEWGVYDRRAIPINNQGVPIGGETNTGGVPRPRIVTNSLGDLTKRENRYAHQPLAWPHDARFWSGNSNSGTDAGFSWGLPTKSDSASGAWIFPLYEPPSSNYPAPNFPGTGQNQTRTEYWPTRTGEQPYTTYAGQQDYEVLIAPDTRTYHQTTPPPPTPVGVSGGHLSSGSPSTAAFTSYDGTASIPRIGGLNTTRYSSSAKNNDFMMGQVICFDVKIWDPGAPIFRGVGDAGKTNQVPAADIVPVAVLPGEPGYIQALQRFVQNSGNAQFAPIGFGAYVDLNYMTMLPGSQPYSNFIYENALANYETTLPGNIRPGTLPRPKFATRGDTRFSNDRSNLDRYTGKFGATIYCTWSTHYEYDGIDQDRSQGPDQGANGIDDDGVNGADDPFEAECPPPYPHAARGIQVRLRVFEPGSRQIREVTVVQEFLQE